MKRFKQFWTNQSLKSKWFYSVALTIVAVYAVVCFFIYIALYAWLREEEEEKARRTVQDLQSYFSTQGTTVTIADLQQQTGLMTAILEQDQTVHLLTVDGTELLRINNYSNSVTVQYSGSIYSEKQRVDDVDVIVVEDAVQIGPATLIIQLIHPLTSFQAMMRYVMIAMLIMAVGAIILSAIISHFLAERLMQPLKRLRQTMITVKEHGVRTTNIKDNAANDEIGAVLYLFDEMMEQLQQSFIRQQRFIFDASHELRTPLQAIEGNLSLLQRWGKEDPQVLEESLEISLEEVRRMKKMMEELLTLARDEEVHHLQIIDVRPLLLTVQQQFQPYDIEIHCEPSIAVSVSEEALYQIARNLIENSIRYCNQEPKIYVEAVQTNTEIVLLFKDNGIGIEAAHLPYIFDRLYKVDDARVHVEGGTGLGLSIVKMLVDKYGGTIRVESEFGKSTSFYIHFPY